MDGHGIRIPVSGVDLWKKKYTKHSYFQSVNIGDFVKSQFRLVYGTYLVGSGKAGTYVETE
jgi:hypothetical protein